MTQKSNTITIEKIVPGGFGIGRLPDGMVALVRYVLPGEKVSLRTIRQRKNHLEAELEKVLAPSPYRCDPVCELYGRCGGCDLQHAGSELQLRLKAEMLAESLIRGGFSPDLAARVMVPVLPAPANIGYRQRIRLQVDGSGRIGFFRYQSHSIEPAASCPLARPEINRVLRGLRSSPTAGKLLRTSLSIELLFNPATGKVIVLLHTSRRPRPADRILAEALPKEFTEVEQLLFHVQGHGSFGRENGFKKPALPPFLELTLPASATGAAELVLTWEAGGFCQINLAQNRNLINIVLTLARPGPRDRVLDLYCGMGNISLPLSLWSAEVTGLDGQGSGIRSAKRNVAINSRRFGKAGNESWSLNCSFVKISVPDGVRQLIRAGRKFDLLVLDPPRQGAAAIIPDLSALGTDRLVYISCDPATLIRDLTALAQIGYQVRHLQPVDMFPQTHHLETVTLLEKQ
jgi:23S rRNA (uracil1939-C5)-methyltransferase